MMHSDLTWKCKIQSLIDTWSIDPISLEIVNANRRLLFVGLLAWGGGVGGEEGRAAEMAEGDEQGGGQLP